jgi:hypothetical protein
MMEQPGLFQQRDQETARRLTTAFMEALSDQVWHKGRELSARLQTNERVLRQIASDSGGSVISGQQGYRLTRYASNDEIDQAERWLKHQGMAMIKRAILIRRSRNRSGAAA